MSRTARKNNPQGPSSSLVDAHNPVLLSPPETDPIQDHLSAYEDHYSPPDQPIHEAPVSRIRRPGMPNVTYTGGGLTTRESRSSQRQSKWLIMVFPPKSLNREPPTLGHTLSSAPAGRFSNGILLPLFPTLYAQLTAIAREFNIPSITGLCVYLQLQENGSTPLTPRISDETWHILWASYFTDDHPAHTPSHGLPVCGRIEFDIDITRAKWYNAWMGFTQEGMSRESSVVPFHWRGESRTSFFHPDLNDDNTSPPQETTLPKPTRRQAPKPLYLEKREFLHQRSSSRNSIRNVPQDVPDQRENSLPAAVAQPFVPNALSPMVQELEEPQSSKNTDLDTMVKKWRESSIIASAVPSIIAASGHPVNPPSSASDIEFKLNLKDFAWSVSSAGPPSQSPASPGWPEKLPSIHLADRMQASRSNTPTSCTSWGPSVGDGQTFDYERQSFRPPSPDIGLRTLEVVPLTPSTCTSWGPDDLPSPVSPHSSTRALSIDVGVRAIGSAPLTPLTCTTWGPADVPSPVLSFRSFGGPSVDLGARQRGSVPVTPSTVTSWGPPDTPVISQRTPTYLPSPYIDGHAFEDLDEGASSCWPHVWPYNQASSSRVSIPWPHVWPYLRRSDLNDAAISSEYTRPIEVSLEQYPALKALYPPRVESSTVSDGVQLLENHTLPYPLLRVYECVYPYNLAEIYPEVPGCALASADLASNRIPRDEAIPTTVCYPTLVIYPPVYPHNLELIYPAISTLDVQYLSPETTGPREYPLFELYPSDYSENNGGKISWPDVNPLSMVTTSNVAYPEFDPYPPAYPFNLDYIYPESAMNLQQSPALEEHTISYMEYPSFTIYPSVYPFNLMDIYPSVHSQDGMIIDDVELIPDSTMPPYPIFDLYPAVYPFNLIEIYPAKSSSTIGDTSVFLSTDGLSARLPELRYPYFEIYPPAYPYSLANIYPAAAVDDDVKGILPALNSGASSPGSGYPFFDIYPPSAMNSMPSEYPQITLYGTVYGQMVEKVASRQEETSASLPNNPIASSHSSPCMDIYPQTCSYGTGCIEGLSFSPAPSYPIFNLYPPVYPFNLESIYGLVDASTSLPASERRVAEHTIDYGVYPHLVIYPAGYPWSISQIYEPIVQESRSLPSNNTIDLLMDSVKDDLGKAFTVTKYSQGYPTFALHHSPHGYPDFVLYPRIPSTEEEKPVIPAIRAKYPTFNLYPPQYPFILVYPDVIPTIKYSEPQMSTQRATPERLQRVNYRYPFFDLYPSVYPHFDLYPRLRPLMQDPTTCFTKLTPPSTMELLEKYEIKPQLTSEQFTRPPIPLKPKTLRGTSSTSNSLDTTKPIRRRRSHHELYMAVINELQRALENESLSEVETHDSEGNQDLWTIQNPSLLRKPSAVTPRFIPSRADNRLVPTHVVGLPSSPKDTRTVSAFSRHVSGSIHNRVQSMHLQSSSQPKEAERFSLLERSKSLSSGRESIVHTRAKLYSAANDKHPPPLPKKPPIKLGESNSTYVQNQPLHN